MEPTPTVSGRVARLANWLTDHLGESIGIVLIVGMLMVISGALVAEHPEVFMRTGNVDGTSTEMLSEQSTEPFAIVLFGNTLEDVGIELIGAIIVAMAFIFLRDPNSERFASLERQISELQRRQDELLDKVNSFQRPE